MPCINGNKKNADIISDIGIFHFIGKYYLVKTRWFPSDKFASN